ncbi:protein AGENET DOMAIN (AGD)-CONTAINING P1-like [Salvia divinorum]|uniref:Protein AGENET DOMAIN (AGD)-CONTAINING P1-like n=1 Tax=Salvia divinorum TaxID=28513 RepID=A0ABD1I4E5_SALDI
MPSIRVSFNPLRFRRGDLVEYRTLLEEDFSGPLREVMSAVEVRPRPPSNLAERYRMNDVVDSYSVFFETTGDDMLYHKNLLRTPQKWTNGRWTLAMLIPIA